MPDPKTPDSYEQIVEQSLGFAPRTSDSKLRELAAKYQGYAAEARAQAERDMEEVAKALIEVAEAVADEVERLHAGMDELASRLDIYSSIQRNRGKRLEDVERRLDAPPSGPVLTPSHPPYHYQEPDHGTGGTVAPADFTGKPTTTDGGVDPNLDTPAKLAPQVAGGKARAASLSPERRTEIARNAANTRWGTTTDGSG